MTSQLPVDAALCAHCSAQTPLLDLVSVAEYPLCRPCLETLSRDLPTGKQGKVPRFYKIRKGKEVEGVCGGLADSFNMDRDNVRVLSGVIIVLSGILPGLLVYVALACIMPLHPSEVGPEKSLSA